MTRQPHRLWRGGRVDRSRVLTFTFDGRRYAGHPGDTLASALLAGGVRLVGRSFKYHRPRGILGAGVEEPNALVTLGEGARAEPNLRATQVELYDGLVARSQNRWPSLGLDVGAVAGCLGALLPAGFYYKTFMWPPRGWRFYEWFIRRAAGLGRASRAPDPDTYAHRYAHCDVLVVGGGPAGLAAALAAGRSGARVILVEEGPRLGGSLLALGEAAPEHGKAAAWLASAIEELDASPSVEVARRTSAAGYYDHNLVVLAERVTDHLPSPPPYRPRHRLWHVRAREVVLATGALERPLTFAGNDRPGVMLASAARRYLNDYGVLVGGRIVCFTTNDGAYPGVLELAAAGAAVVGVVDARPEGPGAHWRSRLVEAGIRLLAGRAVVRAAGRRRIAAVDVRFLAADGASVYGEGERLRCAVLLVSGGWTPNVQLFAQAQGKLAWRDDLGAFVPGTPGPGQRLCAAGSVNGTEDIEACIVEGLAAGNRAAAAVGLTRRRRPPRPRFPKPVAPAPPRRLWLVPLPGLERGKRFVDLQNDVTSDDIGLAVREGYRSVEHLKRYSTLGMGTDQGRTGNLIGLANLASLRGRPIPEVGVTTFRPPTSPVPLGALAGPDVGARLAPVRITPIHDWHLAHGARMVTTGLWLRPECYPLDGESSASASYREARAVRARVGITDVSTLGKIELDGPDAAAFLERIYINRWENLRRGRARYGVMLRDDGMVFDDGTTTRIGEHRYYMTTTTAEAQAVTGWLERHLQVSWPALDVDVVEVTEQWGAIALAGPRAREVLSAVTEGDVADPVLPYLGYAELEIAGVPARVLRVTFSGELGFEVHVPADRALAVWQALILAGAAHRIVPYGTEAMAVLRIEKGHVAGNELDGRTTAADLGLERLARADGKFVGARGMRRAGLRSPGRLQLVGVRSLRATARIPTGGHLVAERHLQRALSRARRDRIETEGHVTSITYSPALDAHVALALLADGRSRVGERLWVASPLGHRAVLVEVVEPAFFDPEGSRARG